MIGDGGLKMDGVSSSGVGIERFLNIARGVRLLDLPPHVGTVGSMKSFMGICFINEKPGIISIECV